MKDFLKRPHPFIFNKNSLIIPFATTVLIMLTFQPFELAQYHSFRLLTSTFIFGTISSLSIWLVIKSLPLFIGDNFEDHWTVGKEIGLYLTVLFLIAITIFCLLYVQMDAPDFISLFAKVVFRTLVFSFFPVLILVLYDQYAYQKTKHQEALRLNEQLRQQHFSNVPAIDKSILIEDENQKVVMSLSPKDLLFLKSEGNYVEIYYLHMNGLEKHLIRNRLKAIEKILPKAYFFRCHKSYLINIQYVLSFAGNARNLSILLKGVEDRIPVARGKSEEIEKLLKLQFPS